MEGPGNRQLLAEVVPVFTEGVGLILSRWSALQLAVENEWGGRDSHRKSDLLCSEILSWFSQTRGPLYIDDLENILDEGLLSLNTMADDGSVEEVAEKLMIWHEECLAGNFGAIEALRQANAQGVAHPHVAEVVNEDDDGGDDDSDDGGIDDMEMSEPRVAAEADDGWVVVGPRRNRR